MIEIVKTKPRHGNPLRRNIKTLNRRKNKVRWKCYWNAKILEMDREKYNNLYEEYLIDRREFDGTNKRVCIVKLTEEQKVEFIQDLGINFRNLGLSGDDIRKLLYKKYKIPIETTEWRWLEPKHFRWWYEEDILYLTTLACIITCQSLEKNADYGLLFDKCKSLEKQINKLYLEIQKYNKEYSNGELMEVSNKKLDEITRNLYWFTFFRKQGINPSKNEEYLESIDDLDEYVSDSYAYFHCRPAIRFQGVLEERFGFREPDKDRPDCLIFITKEQQNGTANSTSN